MKIIIDNKNFSDPKGAALGSAWLVKNKGNTLVVFKVRSDLFIGIGTDEFGAHTSWNAGWYEGWIIQRQLDKGDRFTVEI